MTRRAFAEHGCDWLAASRDNHSKQRVEPTDNTSCSLQNYEFALLVH